MIKKRGTDRKKKVEITTTQTSYDGNKPWNSWIHARPLLRLKSADQIHRCNHIRPNNGTINNNHQIVITRIKAKYWYHWWRPIGCVQIKANQLAIWIELKLIDIRLEVESGLNAGYDFYDLLALWFSPCFFFFGRNGRNSDPPLRCCLLNQQRRDFPLWLATSHHKIKSLVGQVNNNINADLNLKVMRQSIKFNHSITAEIDLNPTFLKFFLGQTVPHSVGLGWNNKVHFPELRFLIKFDWYSANWAIFRLDCSWPA